ncbi:hypothetical protein GCM10009854_07310 [Saccharopolyspora halophila]|uniref:Uncharacterized protein n=1 Tax=Saccharopolyspora halophila TaxID=405551 RepID=A0ABP5SLQ5_9PSEU
MTKASSPTVIVAEPTPRLLCVTARPAPTRGALRVLRGGGLACTSASLSVAAHTAAGGPVPAAGMTAFVTFLLAGSGIALADRQRGPLGILGALGASQLALHAFLEIMSGNHPAAGAHAMHLPAPTMALGHVAVVLFTGLVMTHAERALFVVARLLRAILPRKTGPLPVLTPPPAVCIPAPIARTLAQLIHQRIHAQRGPPKSPFHNIPVRPNTVLLNFNLRTPTRA